MKVQKNVTDRSIETTYLCKFGEPLKKKFKKKSNVYFFLAGGTGETESSETVQENFRGSQRKCGMLKY